MDFGIDLKTTLNCREASERVGLHTGCKIQQIKESRYKGTFTSEYPWLAEDFFFFSSTPDDPYEVAICFSGDDEEDVSKTSAVRFIANVLDCFSGNSRFRGENRLHYLRNGSQTLLLRSAFWTDECRELISRHHPVANVFVPAGELVLRTDERKTRLDHYQRYQPGIWREGYRKGTINGRKVTIHVIVEPSGYCYEDDVYWDVWADEFRKDKSQDV